MGFRQFYLLLVVQFVSLLASAQVRIIQWGDVHSALPNIAWYTQNIDQIAREYKKAHPHGEVVIIAQGDFTYNTPDTRAERGWMSLEALKYLRQQGHTVVFVPGNHDAFDWKFETNGVELFVEQIKTMNRWGVHILAANMKELAPDLEGIIKPYYDFEGPNQGTRLVGMTLQTLIQKSNLDKESSQRIFGYLSSYPETWAELVDQAEKDGKTRLVSATHDAFYKIRDQRNYLKKLFRDLSKTREQKNSVRLQVPVMLSAHDHITGTMNQRGTLISGSGSHGSFTVIDLDKNGQVEKDSVVHYARRSPRENRERRATLKIGEFRLQTKVFSPELEAPELISLKLQMDTYLENINHDRKQVEKLLERFDADERLKGGRHLFGRLFSESLIEWIHSLPGFNPRRYSGIGSLVDPGSHDLEAPFRRLVDNKNAMLFELSGAELWRLYQSFKGHRNRRGAPVYQPQFNKGLRPASGAIEILEKNGKWRPLGRRDLLLIAVDSWLVTERYRSQNAISEHKMFSRITSPFRAPYLSVLMDFLPDVVARFSKNARLHRPAQVSCFRVFRAI